MAQAVRLRGALDVAALDGAFGALVERHEVLRTRLVEGVGGAEQRIDGWRDGVGGDGVGGFALEGLRAANIGEALGVARGFAARRFDLSREWPLRVGVIGLGPEDHVVVVVLHHIAGDGWSVGILARELAALYRGAVTGAPARLPALSVQYVDYAAWQRDWLATGVAARELAYWQWRCGARRDCYGCRWIGRARRCRGIAAVRWRCASTARGGGAEGAVPGRGRDAVHGAAAGFGVVLGRWSGQREVVIGTPVANRLRPELEGLIGFFVNTLALRLGLGGLPTGVELLSRARSVALAGYDHQAVPFERVVEALHPDRSLGHSPLFQAMLVLQPPSAGGGVALAGLAGEELALGSLGAKFDVTLALAETAGGGLAGVLEYDGDLFEAATMARLAAQLGAVLSGLARAPAAPAWRLSLVDAAERARLMARARPRAAVPPRPRAIRRAMRVRHARWCRWFGRGLRGLGMRMRLRGMASG